MGDVIPFGKGAQGTPLHDDDGNEIHCPFGDSVVLKEWTTTLYCCGEPMPPRSGTTEEK